MPKTMIDRLKIYVAQLAVKAAEELKSSKFPRLMSEFHESLGCPTSMRLENNPNYQRHISSFRAYKDSLVSIYGAFPEIHDFFEEHGLGELIEKELAEKRKYLPKEAVRKVI